jgi:hypothetical protein
MNKHGFQQDVANITNASDHLNVFRPGTKVPSDKHGLGHAASSLVLPHPITRAYMTTANQPLNFYESEYAKLGYPDPEDPDQRAINKQLQHNLRLNSNPQVRRRMISIIQEGHMDDITLWGANNQEDVIHHDKVQASIRRQQPARSPWLTGLMVPVLFHRWTLGGNFFSFWCKMEYDGHTTHESRTKNCLAELTN